MAYHLVRKAKRWKLKNLKRVGINNNCKRMKPDYSQDELDNYSTQLNPENDAYWESRGFDERPDDWEERLEDEKDK